MTSQRFTKGELHGLGLKNTPFENKNLKIFFQNENLACFVDDKLLATQVYFRFFWKILDKDLKLFDVLKILL